MRVFKNSAEAEAAGFHMETETRARIGDGDYPKAIAIVRTDLEAQLAEALEAARRQIEYLHARFAKTSSGNATLAKINAALKSARGEA